MLTPAANVDEPAFAEEPIKAREIGADQVEQDVETVVDERPFAPIDDEVPAGTEDVIALEDSLFDLTANVEIRDELAEHVDSNVSQDDLNALLISAIFAIFFKAENEQNVLNFDAYLDSLTVEVLESVNGASFLPVDIAQSVEMMMADKAYTETVFSWFKEGLRQSKRRTYARIHCERSAGR